MSRQNSSSTEEARTRRELSTWWEYVNALMTINNVNAYNFAKSIDASPNTLSAWKNGRNTGKPAPNIVRSVADVYGRPIKEVFVAAGYARPEEMDYDPNSDMISAPLSASRLKNKDLLDELARRLIADETEEPEAPAEPKKTVAARRGVRRS
ncbi:hypothetical protein IU451_28600 [Nocardia cyriacigeorgica]|uniref:hypothetical protein n=1 Tax=Nocardia cyriacigeorgica TaxID=135487 RepID=UPI0018955F64|nr:hypothetical protein [Nocardia cyriacigeorgica]MBF6326462.1 hypothetical protein [Nocardia cyriacigeorgica]